MLPMLLNVAYVFLLLAATPWLVYRRFVQKKPVAGIADKLAGRIARRHPGRPCVWFHAVSVGEVLQLQSLIAEFAAGHPEFEIVITTTTGTGFELAKSKFPQHTIAYWPFDFSWAVDRALKSVTPTLVVLVELELWPNFLLAARRHGIPVALVNGRIGVKSHRGYRRLNWLWRRVLPGLSKCGVQNEEYAERLIDIGLPRNRIAVTGNIKYDRVQSDRRNPQTNDLRRAFGISDGELVFIAGSTQDPEEQYALDAWERLRGEFPSLRLILVPRHKERFDEVAALVSSRGWKLRRRSDTPPNPPLERGGEESCAPPAKGALGGVDPQPTPVCLLDTLGELAACWGLADIAFVGGSLTNRGGQNMLEPAGFGAAVLFGPNTWNFKEIVEQLLNRDAAVVVRDSNELRESVRRLVMDSTERHRRGAAARDFVLTQQGATAKTLDLLESLLPVPTLQQRAA